MALPNKTKLMIGIFCVVTAFVCIGAIFSIMGNANLQDQKKIASLEVQLTNLIAERASGRMSAAEASRAKGRTLTVQDLVEKASGLYSEEEKKKKEGFLWIDREGKTLLVTLGALNGISPGSKLSVYDGDKKVETLTVESIFDVVSYVKPSKRSVDDFKDNYYRVVLENTD